MKEQKYIIRTEKAGVFYAEIVELDKAEQWATLKNARRIWQWYGAKELCQIATIGIDSNSKVTVKSDLIVLGITEVHNCTEEAVSKIEAVPEWKQ